MEIVSLNTSLYFSTDEEDEWSHKIILESLCDRNVKNSCSITE